MIRQFSTASSACPSMEPQISSTSIDENRSLPYHATDPCQMNLSLQTFAKFCDSNILTQIFFNFFSLTLPQLCQNYMSLSVRIGKLIRSAMLTAAKGMRVLVGVIRFFYPSDIQSSCKAKKMPFIFWTLQRNREFKVLCSCHSTAVASALDGPSVRRSDSKPKPVTKSSLDRVGNVIRASDRQIFSLQLLL